MRRQKTTPLRAARLRRRLTQRALAARVGVTESHYSDLERGARRPSIAVALRLARVLGVRVERLFGEDAV
ncbi:MAG TPA: helix-turn-helix transcriptional regulator [Vicinamibacterales bacterium]|nr:helix-turn-helix transcriptional regulator [Vicinamibacterales bacterium]